MARVRYMGHDVDEAVAFYVSKLGFELQQQFGPMIAILMHGDLELLVAGSKTSAGQPMADGTKPTPGGGWARFVLTVDDLESYAAELRGWASSSRTSCSRTKGASRSFASTRPETSSNSSRTLRSDRYRRAE